MDELDSYSRTVSAVAAELTGARRRRADRPGQRLGGRRRRATGSWSPTRTCVGDARRGPGRLRRRHAGRRDRGRHRPAVRPGRAARRPARPTCPPPVRLGDADELVVGQLVVAVGQPARAGRLGDRRRGQRARPGAAHPQRQGRPGGRGRDPDRRRAQPGQLRRRAGRRPRHGWSGSTPRSPGSGWGWRCRSTRPPGGSWPTLLADGRVRRAYLGVVGTPAPVPAAVAERYGRRERAAAGRGDRRQPGRAGRPARRRPGARRRPPPGARTPRASSGSCSATRSACRCRSPCCATGRWST